MQSETSIRIHLTALRRLIRLPLSLMVALSALTGALAAAPALPLGKLWSLGWGIFFVSAACSVLNQVQERTTDALMRRTCQRPLACGELNVNSGTVIGLLLASGGLATLLISCGLAPALLALFGLVWYLLVYTPLKRHSSLAVIAGTPCGALPPLIGWLATGGSIAEPAVLALMLTMTLWQVPHYWLLALPERDELKQAGFKALPTNFTPRQIINLSHIWILALACVTLLLPALQLVTLPLLQTLLAATAIGFALWASRLCVKSLFIEKTAHKLRFGLHLYLALVFGLILIDKILLRGVGVG